MSPYPGTGKKLCQTHQQQGKLFCLLCGPGVCRMSVRIQTALVADADAATVPGAAVRTHFQQFAVRGDGAVATGIEVVTYSYGHEVIARQYSLCHNVWRYSGG